MKFKKLYDKEEFDLVSYLSDYLANHSDADILIGCDSQNFIDRTIYAIVVALYTPGKGAHVLFRRWRTDKEPTRSIRLLNEVWYAVETAEEIKNAGLPKVKWIDIDINPDPKYKSNEVFRQAVGLVEGMGYSVRTKGNGCMATYAADNFVKL
jgi:predicted RNase H-related nuclease YkuK (DUF458 family)